MIKVPAAATPIATSAKVRVDAAPSDGPKACDHSPNQEWQTEPASQDQRTGSDRTEETADSDRRVEVPVRRLARLQDVDGEDHGDDLEAAAEEPCHQLDHRETGQRPDTQRRARRTTRTRGRRRSVGRILGRLRRGRPIVGA
jgi:hypothetical protein